MKENTSRNKNENSYTVFGLKRLKEGLEEYKLIRELNNKRIKGIIKHYEFKFYEYKPFDNYEIYRYHYLILMELGSKDLHSLIKEKIETNSTWTPNQSLIIMK